eukprot:6331218-Pyramimonas_sp.AAC.1
MLEALEPEEAAFYALVRSVMADPARRSRVIFMELEQQCGFLGGEYSECVKYLNPARPRAGDGKVRRGEA